MQCNVMQFNAMQCTDCTVLHDTALHCTTACILSFNWNNIFPFLNYINITKSFSIKKLRLKLVYVYFEKRVSIAVLVKLKPQHSDCLCD